MRISDWSSDVCSSDLGDPGRVSDHPLAFAPLQHLDHRSGEHQCAGVEGLLTARSVDSAGRSSKGRRSRAGLRPRLLSFGVRSEEHTSELQSLMRSSYAVFCLKKKKKKTQHR